ncbi:hypothetical protein LguiA_013887 [Lonicera macranthoides]
MGKWSELPVNLLMDIEKHLGSNAIEDYFGLCIDKIRVRAVCMSWRSFLPKMPLYKQGQFPWLLQALNNTKGATHGLFNLIEKKVYEIDLDEVQGRLFKGSSYGWVVATVEDNSTNPSIYLINPLTRTRIDLPPRNKFPDIKNYRPDKIGTEYAVLYPDGKTIYFIDSAHINTYFLQKIVLSSTPSDNDCVAVAIYGECGTLAYCKCKDKKWTALRHYRESYEDVIFHRGKLHALKCDGTLIVFENIGPNAKVTEIAAKPPHTIISHLYLVESSLGELVMVERIPRCTPKEGTKSFYGIFKTVGFRVYKQDPKTASWILVKNLGGDALFLGYNSSFAVSSSSGCFPSYEGNCIYFTDNLGDYHSKGNRGGSDIGVYNLETGRIKELEGFKCDPDHIWPPPLWVTPSRY